MRPHVVILLLALPLAGCADTPRVDEPAASWAAVAEDAAMTIEPGARLLGIAGLEAADGRSWAAQVKAPPDWLRPWARDDRGPSDGRLPAWLYAFLGDGDPVYVVVADGRVVFADRVDEADARQDIVRLGTPGPWTVDAPEARATLAAAGAMPPGPVVWQLARDEDGPATWRAHVPGTEAQKAVHAVDGTVVPIEEEEQGQAFDARLDVTRPEAAWPFEKEGDDGLRGRLELVEPLPMTLVELRLVAPDGTVHAAVANGDQGGTAQVEAVLAPEGTWALQAVLVRGAVVDVQVAWCGEDDASGEGRGSDAARESEDVITRCRTSD